MHPTTDHSGAFRAVAHILFAAVIIGCGGGPARAPHSGSPGFRNPQGTNSSSVALERGSLKAVIVNNDPVDDAVLPGHRGGYSGVGFLSCGLREGNLFVPDYAGLNFEHIHDGATQSMDVLFEPRRAPMTIRRTGPWSAELRQPPTPHWKLESRLTYSLTEDCAIELSIECIPRARTFANGYIGLFFASYIHRPESLDIHFLGHHAGAPDTAACWIRGVTPSHGTYATHPASNDRRMFPHDRDFPLTLVFNLSDYRYAEPWYYGVSRGMALVFVFRDRDRVRFSQSPSGGGAGNPAWDFQWFIPDYEVGKTYRFVMRALYLPYESPEQIAKAVEPHYAALNGKRTVR